METGFMRIEDLEQLQKKLQGQLSDVAERVALAKQEKRQLELDAIKPLAIKAHDVLCAWNHTDGCGWCYEIHGNEHCWTGKYSAHARWLAAVESWLEHKRYGEQMTAEKLEALLDHIAAGKLIHKDFLFIVRTILEGACSMKRGARTGCCATTWPTGLSPASPRRSCRTASSRMRR